MWDTIIELVEKTETDSDVVDDSLKESSDDEDLSETPDVDEHRLEGAGTGN